MPLVDNAGALLWFQQSQIKESQQQLIPFFFEPLFLTAVPTSIVALAQDWFSLHSPELLDGRQRH
jgi:hypothetical protein